MSQAGHKQRCSWRSCRWPLLSRLVPRQAEDLRLSCFALSAQVKTSSLFQFVAYLYACLDFPRHIGISKTFSFSLWINGFFSPLKTISDVKSCRNDTFIL